MYVGCNVRLLVVCAVDGSVSITDNQKHPSLPAEPVNGQTNKHFSAIVRLASTWPTTRRDRYVVQC